MAYDVEYKDTTDVVWKDTDDVVWVPLGAVVFCQPRAIFTVIGRTRDFKVLPRSENTD